MSTNIYHPILPYPDSTPAICHRSGPISSTLSVTYTVTVIFPRYIQPMDPRVTPLTGGTGYSM